MDPISRTSTTSTLATVQTPRLTVELAQTAGDVEDAQRLRYKVFAEEFGARVGSAHDRLDRDEYDPFCDHLVVRDLESLSIVGTYRLLPPDRARAVGRLYSEREFDLAPLRHMAPSMVEAGRACVHPDYRNGSVLRLLWSGLAQYLRTGRYEHLIGCASVSLSDGGGCAARVRLQLQAFSVDPKYRVSPRTAWPYHRIEPGPIADVPSLLNGYLKVGARIGGDPAWDPDFNSADFFVWLSLFSLNARYARRFDLLAADPTCVRAH